MENYITEITERLNKECFNITSDLQVSEDGLTLIHGLFFKECVLIFTKQDDLWVFQQKLIVSDAASGDFFGISVSLSSDGNTALVGAFGKSFQTGAAYIFIRSGSTWTQQQKLIASDPDTYENFGISVSLSSDGNTALVGADRKSSYTGAAYIFIRSGSSWTQQAKLVASDSATSDKFGASVSLSSDGNTALVGAHGADPSGISNAGAAYIFTRSGSTWTQQQKLVASDSAADDWFGVSVSLSTDGTSAKIYTQGNREYIFTLVG